MSEIMFMSEQRREFQMAKRHGGDKRGNAASRRARKMWMLATWGDGEKCPCAHCGSMVNYHTLEADRIIPGGSYRRENVQPSCKPCNLTRSDNVAWTYYEDSCLVLAR